MHIRESIVAVYEIVKLTNETGLKNINVQDNAKSLSNTSDVFSTMFLKNW